MQSRWVFPVLKYQNSFDWEIRILESSLKWGFLHRFLTHINLCFNLKSLKWSVPLCFYQMKNKVWLPAAWKWNPCFMKQGLFYWYVLLVLCCAELIWHVILYYIILYLKYYNELCEVPISLKAFFTKFVLHHLQVNTKRNIAGKLIWCALYWSLSH